MSTEKLDRRNELPKDNKTYISDKSTGEVQRNNTESEGEWSTEEGINEESCAKSMSCLKLYDEQFYTLAAPTGSAI